MVNSENLKNSLFEEFANLLKGQNVNESAIHDNYGYLNEQVH